MLELVQLLACVPCQQPGESMDLRVGHAIGSGVVDGHIVILLHQTAVVPSRFGEGLSGVVTGLCAGSVPPSADGPGDDVGDASDRIDDQGVEQC